jgi:thiol-disulfide isomerase/thioredoxin
MNDKHTTSPVQGGRFIVLALLAIPAIAASASSLQIGGTVTSFDRKDATGRQYDLNDVLKGSKAVVVDFWSARCPVSKKYEPVLTKLASDYGPKGVVFLPIDANFNEPADEIEKVRKERSVPYPVLMDGQTGELAMYFAASHTPEAYLITPAGTLAYHGNLDEIGAALDAVLAGKPVPKAKSKAFGCSIKRP